MNALDFYEKNAVAQALVEEYRPRELIFEVANFIQAQVDQLLRERMLSLATFEFMTQPGERIHIECHDIEMKDGVKKSVRKNGSWPALSMDFGWGWFGMDALARKKDFARLGKQGFIQRQWEDCAILLMAMDKALRLEHNAPMPQGLAARVEAAVIGREAGPGRGKTARPL